MALIQSKHIGLGWKKPSFSLQTAHDQQVNLNQFNGESGTLIIFTCNHCPYAISIWDRLIQYDQDWNKKGILTLAINPNIHPDYPEDSIESTQTFIQQKNLKFPYLIDKTQKCAELFQAQCTPDLYLFCPQGTLYYHGRFDNGSLKNDEISSHDLMSATQSLIKKEGAPLQQKPSIGCSIKWRNKA